MRRYFQGLAGLALASLSVQLDHHSGIGWSIAYGVAVLAAVGCVLEIVDTANRLSAKERARERVKEELVEAMLRSPQAREDWDSFLRDCQTRRNAPRN